MITRVSEMVGNPILLSDTPSLPLTFLVHFFPDEYFIADSFSRVFH